MDDLCAMDDGAAAEELVVLMPSYPNTKHVGQTAKLCSSANFASVSARIKVRLVS